MKKVSVLFAAAIVALALVAGCTKGYESQKTTGDLKITLGAASYPLVKGNNSLSVTITDAAGKTVTDAQVDARYYMPQMPGMAPMEYTVQPTLSGGAYSFIANIPMEGGWKVDVTAAQPGKPAATATFNVDAR